MSKSRLEKFLYALYSLDSSDLPNPLSRIEELYKCLVTGDEAPTFEPLSRVEKYLMAILGSYDVELLPNPLSRVEVLLYKLATGDDNLDDFKSFLSEHEELLAEIIRNGGVGGNIDIEYVLYTLSTKHNTLYNTAEKPVKSAILSGQTLANLSSFKSLKDVTPSVLSENSVVWHASISKDYFNPSIFKPNTKYIVKFGMGTPSRFKGMYISGLNMPNKNGYYSEHNDVFTTPETTPTEGVNVYFKGIDGNVVTKEEYSKIEPMIIEYQEGMENWDIPYFEGMQSVKMPVLRTVGKNLFDKNKSTSEYYIDSTGNYVTGGSGNFINQTHHINNNRSVSVSYSERIGAAYVRLAEFDKNNNFIRRTMVGDNGNLSFNLNTNTYYIVTSVDYNNNNYFTDLQIEFSPVATSYEPFKSNILTTNEEIELRGIGEVKDELNLLTSEYVQRIGEIVLDGSEDWRTLEQGRYNIKKTLNNVNRPNLSSINFKCDKLKPITFSEEFGGTLGICLYGETDYDFIVRVDFQTVNEFKQWLSNNPTTVQYQLATESVKTVDLSVVNQDGNDTKLSTFNDVTHLTLSSEGLVPEAELEVATKNEEDLEDSIVYTTHTLSEEFNTLYNTAKKPVESAILKGKTLVNLLPRNPVTPSSYIIKIGSNISVKSNTVYTIITPPNTSGAIYPYNDAKTPIKTYAVGCYTFNTLDNYAIDVYVRPKDISTSTEFIDDNYFEVMIIEGDYTNEDIPYFEGMKSVKMPVLTTSGKNLLNMNNITLGSYVSGYGGYGSEISFENDAKRAYITIPVKPNTKYTYKSNNIYGYLRCMKNLAVEAGLLFGNSLIHTITTTEETNYISINLRHTDETVQQLTREMIDSAEIMFVEGEDASSYEPYKSDILTVNEPVELRGIGDVRDELNVLTGEIIERTSQGILNGTETWTHVSNSDRFYTRVNTLKKSETYNNLIIADKIHVEVGHNYDLFMNSPTNAMTGFTGITSYPNENWIYLKIIGIENVESLKAYLQQNPINYSYVLGEEIIKTVDLSVVNQDGNDTKLSTFNDVTHLTLSSEGLVPEAELEVAEKVPEVAASMLTISREQEVINTTANEQSENVDATMIATTEIYEELL